MSRLHGYEFEGVTKLGHLLYVRCDSREEKDSLLYDVIRREHFKQLKDQTITELSLNEWEGDRDGYLMKAVMAIEEEGE